MRIHIANGRVIDPASGLDTQADVFVAAGRILALGTPPEGFNPNRVIDATGDIVCPGLVDLSARLREPGFEYKATLESEMEAAVAGGVTSLACPPDTDPPLDEPGLVEMLKHRAKSLNLAHVYPLGALTQDLKGERLTEMTQLSDAGCVAFFQAERSIVDTHVLLNALKYAATFGYGVWLRAHDPFLAHDGVAHEGVVAGRLGLPGIPIAAETVALATLLVLVRETGARVHLCRLSSRAGIEMVRQAKADGLPLSCDVAIHHVHLSEMDIGYFDPQANLAPPLRSADDRAAIRTGLADGTIDAICSDHTPVDDDAKQLPFGEAAPGATGLELLLPLTLKWAAETGTRLTDALARVTAHPARILGLESGRIAPGLPADICVFSPDETWQITPAALRSQGKNTPLAGLEMNGRVRHTLVAGHAVFDAAAGVNPHAR